MKGKFHTEEAVIPILQRKSIIVREFGNDEHGNQIIIKQIGIPMNVQPGIRLLGKLDFMRRMGWKVMKMDQMTASVKEQKNKREKSQEKEAAPKKKFFKFAKKK